MIRYRAFHNDDVPALVDIWRSQGQIRGRVQPMSVALLDRLVLAKGYFDRQGLIVAVDGQRAVGFVHAGFGPTPDGRALSTRTGVISMLMVRPGDEEAAIRDELLARGEQYLLGRGAQIVYGGEYRQVSPFYLGLYGGSRLPGVLESDERSARLFRSRGYETVDETTIVHRDLMDFSPPLDRRQMQHRRTASIQVITDPAPADWWEACTLGQFDLTRFELRRLGDAQPVGRAAFWSMEAFSVCWGVHAVGLVDLNIAAEARRAGLATYLVSTALQELRGAGVSLVEAQTSSGETAAAALLGKLGFRVVERAAVFRKPAIAS